VPDKSGGNIHIPDGLHEVIVSETLTLDQKIQAVKHFAMPTFNMDTKPPTMEPAVLTQEDAEIVIEALKNNLFAMENTANTSITCNKCGRIDTHINPMISLEDMENDPDLAIRKAKMHFRKQGWLTTWGYDLCPKCSESLTE